MSAPARFEKIPQELDFPEEEKAILALWRERRVFERSLEKPSPAGSFVFYEGPPTANGVPHNGHVLTRVIKDLFPRYKTMRGHRVGRKAGWDTHGLPVEVEVEKELRIHGKAAIEAYGVEPFVRRCIESVFRYTAQWERLTERIGFWVDLKDAYVTFHRSYVESVWWALSELHKKGLLYQGHKVVWWWAQGGTALSSAEVGQGYKTVDDPSSYVAFPITGGAPSLAGASLLVWTTTPWTLPSNSYAAVNPKHAYVVAEVGATDTKGKAHPMAGKRFVLARDLVGAIEAKIKGTLAVASAMTGSELVGTAYEPPFDLYATAAAVTVSGAPYFKVIAADFVTLDSGTGIVHIAPAFGEDDFNAHRKILASLPDGGAGVPLLCAVGPDGAFLPEMGKYAGRWVKDCDKDLQDELARRGLLVHSELYRHDYPFCWRADSDPLIQHARPAWYIRTTAKKDQALANNEAIDWLPEHIKEGRFGDFLRNNVDWALSRERYWGTPLNVWINDETGALEAPASMKEILAKNPRAFDHFDEAKKKDPSLSEHLVVHKPWIDQVTWQKPGEPGTYRRVPEVIDCWFDSGAMPFAQWGFPHVPGSVEKFRESFPADFISEAIDQTRGWFYTLLMISTLVFDADTQERFGIDPPRPYPHPFKSCIVLGHVGDKEGKKESKSKGNYTPPDVIIERVRMEFGVLDGADAGVAVSAGTCLIAREDLEGLDLNEGARVRLYRAIDAGGEPLAPVDIVVRAGKKMRRRVVALSPEDQAKLGVKRTSKVDVAPVEVPRLPDGERVWLEDPSSSAPGADAFRWFFYAQSPPWTNTRHSLSNVRALQKETLIRLRNVYSFFVIYGSIDDFDPFAPRPRAPDEASPSANLDRWILDLLQETTFFVGQKLEAFDVYGATKHLTEFVDALSNWYVRRSRDRFWKSGWDDDKRAAYATLYEALVTTAKLMAPFTPFLAESMHQNLVVRPAAAAGRREGIADSVHLEAFPKAERLESRERITLMAYVRDIVSLGLQARTQGKLKVRQPLRVAHVVVPGAEVRKKLEPFVPVMREELNVLRLEFVDESREAELVDYALKPDFRALGTRNLGKEAQKLKSALAALSPDRSRKLWRDLSAAGAIAVGPMAERAAAGLGELAAPGLEDLTELRAEDVLAECRPKAGFAAADGRIGGALHVAVVLETTLDDELRDLGFLRELQSRVQAARKDAGLDFADRIRLSFRGSARLARVIEQYRGELSKEVLATELAYAGPLDTDAAREPGTPPTQAALDVDGESVGIDIVRAG
jgi:isoleucyl-tRNA synthetase